MSKITLTNLVNLQNETTAVNAINTNNAVLTTALDNTLSRDGTLPNTMGSALDMNSNQILNLPAPGSANSPLRLQDLTTFNGTGSITVGYGTASTITALKSLVGGSYQAINVLGYYASGDGGGGVFYWDGASVLADNAGSVIAPSVGTGRWIRFLANGIKQYTPKMFGARGDGTNDKTYVQNLIDVLFAAGGGTIYFDTTYTVGGTLHTNGFSILDLKSGVNFDGPGGLKLADNTNVASSVFTATFSGTTMTVTAVASGSIVANQFLSGTGLQPVTKVVTQLSGTANGVGTYQTTTTNSIAVGFTVKGINRMVELVGCYNSTSNSIVNTSYKNITMDYNGQNNCATQTIWSFNAVCSIQTGSDVTFDNVSFKNNCGSNTLVLGTYQTTLTLLRVSINNCSFSNDGDRINTASADYSTIFAVVSGLNITGCRFTLGPSTNGAAWEVYGQNIDIVGNIVHGYYQASNVVAIANQTTKNVNISGNTIQDCSSGFTLWTLATTSKLRGISICNNVLDANVSAPGGPYLVNGTGQVTTSSELSDILISGNTFQNFTVTDITRTSAGISLNAVLTAKISDNILNGIPGPGIYITGTLTPTSISITDNKLINTGYCNVAASKTGITLDASGVTGTLLIDGNLINPISGYTLTNGIKNALSVTTGAITNNVITSATTSINNTGANVSTGLVGASLNLTGATSGTTILTPNAVASGTVTIPAGTYAVVGDGLGQTLTNKTLTTPIIGPTVSTANGALMYDSTQLALGSNGAIHYAITHDQVQTLTNKTLTTPVVNSPTGIVKGDVGLGNVDNTSDATKNSASVTLTNKTLTLPVLSTGTPTTAAAIAYNAGLITYGDGGSNRSIVASDTSQTLTNKFISGSTNTLSNISTNTPLLFSAGNLVSLVQNSTFYFTSCPPAATENVVAIPMSVPGTLKNMYASTNNGPGGAQTYTLTVRKNGIDQTLACSMTGAATTANNIANTVAFVAGDLISIKLVTSATAATATGMNVGLTLVTTSP